MASEQPPQGQQQPLSSPRYVSQLYVIPAVDAAEAGKGQLEISVNQGQVPNNVQMQDAGRCLVTFIPQHAGSYMIDVTFNGLQVHGCPIKVDVRERQVGKPVSAPVYARPATAGGYAGAGTSPPTRGPSSAYYSSASPHVDTTTFSASSYAPSPSSPPPTHPRSPPMVAGLGHSPAEHRRTPGTSGDLRSPGLVKQQQQQTPTGKGLLGYTVAQYGSKEKIVSTTTTTTTTGGYQQQPISREQPQSPRHKYFGEETAQPLTSPSQQPQGPSSAEAPASTAQFEMTRSAELTLFREQPRAVTSPRQTEQEGGPARREIPIHHIYDRVPDGRQLTKSPPEPATAVMATHKAHDLPYAPLDQRARKTIEWIRSKLDSVEEGGPAPAATFVDVQHRTDSARSAVSEAVSPVSTGSRGYHGPPPLAQIQTHIVEPYSSDIETALTPGTRRRLLEHSVYKAADLKDVEAERRSAATGTDHEESEGAPSSRHSSKATTPRLSLKFRGSKDKVAAAEATGAGGGGGGAFDWGKSKLSSKHEVVRRGKEVDVRVDGLKLGKEDQLKVVVLPPSLARQQQPADQPAQQPPELVHKLKKTAAKQWEVSFRPSEVGTHKVLVFVNNQPHPQTPFPIRVYDAAQIVVGDIVRQSVLNDTVEFTVDAGRAGFGNLEMAIKDHEGIIIPSHVSQLEAGAAKFLVTFNPSSPGTHTVHITFNKEVVKGSPFEVHIIEPADGSPMPGKKGKKEKRGKEKHSQNGSHSKSSSKEAAISPPHHQQQQQFGTTAPVGGRPLVSKLPSLSRVGRPVELAVTMPRAEDLVQAQVHDLDREQLDVQVVQPEEGPANAKKIQFIPKRVGDHEVEIRVGGVEVEGSPFTCRVYDPAKILVGAIPGGSVDKPVSFVVDASQAGVGNLEVAVNEGKIPSMAHALGQHKYEISFVPKEPIDHHISVRFNNESVPGSPFLCRLVSVPPPPPALHFSASGPGLERIPVGQPTEFFVDAHPAEDQPQAQVETLPRVQITDPRGEPLPVDVAAYEEEPTRTVVRYTPRSVGNHQISIKWNGQPIGGSPFTAKAFDANCVKLALDGEGGQVGRACAFTIDAAKAGAGNMEIIVSVGRRNVPNYVQAEGQARFRVSFTPQEAQEHQISVKFNGVPVPGSPMHCPVLPAPPRSPRPSRQDTSDSVRTAEHLLVPPAPSSALQPPPEEHKVGGQAQEHQHEEELRIVGDMTIAQIGHPKRFSIDAPPGSGGRVDCNVVVVGPDKRRLPVQKQRVDGGSFDITFVPTQIGDHHIDIQLDGRSLAICPIVCRCQDGQQPTTASGEEVIPGGTGRAGPTCGKDFMFEVKLPQRTRKEHLLGELYTLEGHQQVGLHLDMHPSGERALCSFRALQKPQRYQFTLYRDGSIVEERVLEATPEPGPNEPVQLLQFPDPILVEHTARFELARTSHNQQWLDEDGLPSVQIFDAAGTELPVHLHCLADGRIRADWQPQSEGRHRVQLRDRDGQQQLCGSPLPVTVLDLSAVRVVGLRNDVVGAEQSLTLDWTNSGGQSASVAVHHESGEPVKCTMKRLKRGIHSVAFTPRLPGLHLLTILVDGMELPECPYECLVSDRGSARARGDALARAQRGKTARFEVSPGTSTPTRAELDVVVTNPQGSPLPVRCYKQQDDSYWVEFTPEVCGTHSIEVTFGEEPIHGSPFSCEVIDPRKVQVRGIDRPFPLRTLAHFTVNRKAAGNGPLNAELADPQGETLKMDRVKNSLGEDSFTFVPTKLGVHRLALKLAGFAVPDSPFQLLVEEQRAPAVYGGALDYAVERGQQASLIFDAGKQPGGLKVDVRSPGGERVRHGTNRRPDDTTEIAFRPQEVGLYQVGVEFNNRPVHGSPFPVSVVDPAKVVVVSDDDGAAQQRFRPDGLLQLVVGQRNVLDVDATAAGPAKLRAEIRDADGELLAGDQQAQVHSLGYGKFQLAFTPRRPGKYKVYLYCSELVVPSAYPLLAIAELPRAASTNGGGPVVPPHEGEERAAEHQQEQQRQQHIVADKHRAGSPDLAKVLLRGDGLTTGRVREPAEFVVDASEVRGALGKCSASLHGDKADVPVKISALRNQVFKGVYTPLVGGTYQLSVYLDGKHVPGSPSVVQVQSHAHPAELIGVDDRPLKMGIIGDDLRTVIDARRAGPGQISAQCSGPSGPEYCELLDNRDGTYVLRVQPKELGRHSLAIKYENEHVRGSPFVFPVNHPPDPSKVKVFGPGIEHGILHSFKSNFVVETKGAGAGQLTVRVRGPKGAFNVEMQRDRQQERTIHCKYEPREPGDYQVEVKWHGQHVPGSPFFVLIVDTEQELHRFLAGSAPSPTPPSPFVPPGWLSPGPPPGLMPHPGPMPIMAPPPPHFVKGPSGRATPGSSVSGVIVPVHHHHGHHPPPPPHHHGPRLPSHHPQQQQQQPVYGGKHH